MVAYVAVATYPGTATPLRGLSAFGESDRDVLFGRDRERDELTQLITGEGFRAGLLYGVSGVGKTSFIAASLIPHLRDHGVLAVLCDNPFAPIESLAHALVSSGGGMPAEGEQSIDFLARVVGGAMPNQLYLFIVDGAEQALAHEQVVGELGDLFARVVARSRGRARFLFSCSSESIHLFGKLEQRTGSLFPPSSRYELSPLLAADANMVLERTLALAGVDVDTTLAPALASSLAQRGPILPADLQICALAVREFHVRTADDLTLFGGPSELERRWLSLAAAATGNERSGLRLLAELAHGTNPVAPEWAAAQASLDPAYATQALVILQQRGIVTAIPLYDTDQFHYKLIHEVLASRLREIAAPARASARRAFELLGSKAAQNKRLGVAEYLDIRREGIEPSTPAELGVIQRTRKTAKIVLGAAIGVPIFLLIVIYVSMSGSYYLDVSSHPGGSGSVVVRAGSPGLSWFHWMPASPGFGSVIADTGFPRAMISDEAWDDIRNHDITGDGDTYAATALATLKPIQRDLIGYAASGSETTLQSLTQGAATPEKLASLLEALRPISRAGAQEVALVERAIVDPSPIVQKAALTLAAVAVSRHQDGYRQTISQALASSDDELRRLAFSTVRSLDSKLARALFEDALGNDPTGTALQELNTVVAAPSADKAHAASIAAAVLANPESSPPAKARARAQLTRAFALEPRGAALEATQLFSGDATPLDQKLFALKLLTEYAPKESFPDMASALGDAINAPDEALRAAALPLFARAAPTDAAGVLATMLSAPKLSQDIRAAMALGWGELARTGSAAAVSALETLIQDRNSTVRAAAATASGYLGRSSQETLINLIKRDGFEVAIAAAYGLVNSAEVGASSGNAVFGIAQLWKRKGRARREAARVYATMARTNPRSAYTYIAAAARSTEDLALRPIGVEGLCNALRTKDNASAARALARSTNDESLSVRRLVIQCVADLPDQVAVSARISSAMIDDADAEIRTEAARVMASIAQIADPPKEVKTGLTKLAKDDVRAVRIVAIGAIAALGANAPEAAAEVLPRAFEVADEAEKLVILEAAQSVAAGGLVAPAMADESPVVRIAGLDTALATGTSVATAINAALADPDAGLRRAALLRLADGKHGLGVNDTDRALSIAIRDSDESIRGLALRTLAKLGTIEQVQTQLGESLKSRSEQERARAAAALEGLAEHKPQDAVDLLEPLLSDPSHDVRAAMLPALAAAYAKIYPADELSKQLLRSEEHATRRLTIAAAFVVRSRTEAGKAESAPLLTELVETAPPLAAESAKLAAGLLVAQGDGVSFLASLVP